MKPREVEFAETDTEEEKAKKLVLDANLHCPKCGAHLTKHAYKMLEFIKNKPDKLAVFGLDKADALKAAEVKEGKYKEASKITAEQALKDAEEGKKRAGLK